LPDRQIKTSFLYGEHFAGGARRGMEFPSYAKHKKYFLQYLSNLITNSNYSTFTALGKDNFANVGNIRHLKTEYK